MPNIEVRVGLNGGRSLHKAFFPLLRGGAAAPIKECNATEQKSVQPGEVLRAGRRPPRRADILAVALCFLNRRGNPSSKEGKTLSLHVCPLENSVGQAAESDTDETMVDRFRWGPHSRSVVIRCRVLRGRQPIRRAYTFGAAVGPADRSTWVPPQEALA